VFDAFWKQMGIYAEGFYDQFSDAPMVHMSAWYDPYPRTATTNYIGLSHRKKGPVRLILGPWTHGDRSITYAGDVDFGPAATLDGNLAPDFLTLRLRWFDCWLKGAERRRRRAAGAPLRHGRRQRPANAEGRLDHGGRWRAERDWPIPDARARSICMATAPLSPPSRRRRGAAPAPIQVRSRASRARPSAARSPPANR
jgi:putative CocE/NonD family hydrolase